VPNGSGGQKYFQQNRAYGVRVGARSLILCAGKSTLYTVVDALQVVVQVGGTFHSRRIFEDIG
jgi:hypothetical protein